MSNTKQVGWTPSSALVGAGPTTATQNPDGSVTIVDSNGNTVTIPAPTVDTDTWSTISGQTITTPDGDSITIPEGSSYNAATSEITLSDGSVVDLASFDTDTDTWSTINDQTITTPDGDSLTIPAGSTYDAATSVLTTSDGNSVDLSSFDTDTDTFATFDGTDTITFADGSTVTVGGADTFATFNPATGVITFADGSTAVLEQDTDTFAVVDATTGRVTDPAGNFIQPATVAQIQAGNAIPRYTAPSNHKDAVSGYDAGYKYPITVDNDIYVGTAGSGGPTTTALGHDAGRNVTSIFVTAIGAEAAMNSTATTTTAVGALAAKNTGATPAQTAVGTQAGENSSGSNSTMVGRSAGQNNSGTQLTALGVSAGKDNTGEAVTAVGYVAAQNNTGLDVTAVGLTSAAENVGAASTFVGRASGQFNTGADATGIGRAALEENTGLQVSALGLNAGRYNTLDNTTHIGFGSQALQPNEVRLGNTLVTRVFTSGAYYGAGFNVVCDERAKKGIRKPKTSEQEAAIAIAEWYVDSGFQFYERGVDVESHKRQSERLVKNAKKALAKAKARNVSNGDDTEALIANAEKDLEMAEGLLNTPISTISKSESFVVAQDVKKLVDELGYYGHLVIEDDGNLMVDFISLMGTVAYGQGLILRNLTKPGNGSGKGNGKGNGTESPANGVIVSDNFQDGNGNAPYNLQVRNTTGESVNWIAVVSDVPYSEIPDLKKGGYTLDVSATGDTYSYTFEGTLSAYANIVITGGLPTPAGTGSGLELFVKE